MRKCLVLICLLLPACSVRQAAEPAAKADASNAPYKKLSLTVDKAIVGSEVRVTGDGLPAGKPVELLWGTVNGGWVVEDYYHFKGKNTSKSPRPWGHLMSTPMAV